jgi:CelD/BcsL family acetyltransferase involved in cellulose biosynthesis
VRNCLRKVRCYRSRVSTLAPAKEPACPGSTDAPGPASSKPAPGGTAAPVARRATVGDVSRETWDRLAAANPWATPFSGWAFQRAWWDAYHANARDETIVVSRPGNGSPDELIGIVPLMHRHEVEPADAGQATKIRHGDGGDLTAVDSAADAIFFGASYHADYATILAAPADLPAVAEAAVGSLAGQTGGWDAVDLRRLRCGDPAADALAAAFGRREMAEGWTLNLEREDVCPIVTFADGASFDDYLGTLDKKDRHEIRRKLRRAESAGDVVVTASKDPAADLDDFIDLHQRKWGADGLFPPTAGGAASRVFIRRLFEESGPDGPVRLSFLSVGERRVAAGIHIESGDTWMFYNAGIDPDARELSPGVVFTAMLIRQAIERGARRFDFLRGNEAYKYEWGANDEPIQRLLVRRTRGDA